MASDRLIVLVVSHREFLCIMYTNALVKCIVQLAARLNGLNVGIGSLLHGFLVDNVMF